MQVGNRSLPTSIGNLGQLLGRHGRLPVPPAAMRAKDSLKQARAITPPTPRAAGAKGNTSFATAGNSLGGRLAGGTNTADAGQVENAFTSFVGQTFFGQLLRAMRSSLGKPAYFHGGRAEEIFQGQLDQVLAEKMTTQSAAKFSEPMFARQFPHLAQSLHSHSTQPNNHPSLADLRDLRQR